jgi:S-DNA-T family DNA segregation ATPase FtsK/SpoIIIE
MHGTLFKRPPRAYPERLPEGEFLVAVPPTLQTPQQGGAASWLQFLFPLVGSLGSLGFIIAFHAQWWMIALGLGTALFSVLIGLLMRIQQQRALKKRQKADRKRYQMILEQQITYLKDLAQRQQKVEAYLYPAAAQIAAGLVNKERFWERRRTDGDFLHVRVGAGSAPLCCRVRLDLGATPGAEYNYEPDLLAYARSIAAQYDHLESAPITIPLRDIGLLAITGQYTASRTLLRAMLSQIAIFHAPDDVRVVAYYPSVAAHEWSWLKWLPHSRRLRQVKVEQQTPEPLCMLAETLADFDDLLNKQIKPELDRRRKLGADQREQGAAQMKPHLICILDGFASESQLSQLPVVAELFQDAARLGVTVICLVDDRRQEPSLVQARLSVSQDGHWLRFEENAFGGRRLEGILADSAAPALCEQIARKLAPFTLDEKGSQRDLSQDIRLIELLEIDSADAVDPARTWQPRPLPHLLRVPIGMSAEGEPLILDLKEAAEKGMGPHGLVVGATGSGKSELLRTIVTSLAITHPPHLLNFVLVDFKGGASFADLAVLPHVAGMITNLQSDESLVDRMYAALLGEQERRQRMLREAGNLDNIKQYQAKRQMVPSLEPMPYLLIIVDEFAELLADRPDFLDLFISIGRVGRSLGLHLLMATQRIDEGRIKGLEGHLRYRICLRTFSASESAAVLSAPDAYFLPSFPGIGYFKVDTDIYTLFKSATVSAPYIPAGERKRTLASIREFTSAGKLALLQAAPDATLAAGTTSPAPEDSLHTEMDVIIQRLADERARERQPAVHQVWLPPLEANLTLGEILVRARLPAFDGSRWPAVPPLGPLCVPIGLLDRPREQTQEPLRLNFSGAGGHLALAGAPQSGKSTLLRSIITSFVLTHTPGAVQFYCIDLGGGLLRVFEHAPHVGAVCSKAERDKIIRTIHKMVTIIEERELFFRERGIDGISSYRERRLKGEFSDQPYGDIFLVIDDLAQLLNEFPQVSDDITALVSTGLTYGVHVILATNRWADVRAKLRENIGARLELRLNDPAESDMGRTAAKMLTAATPGRGLTKEGLQFQTALPVFGSGSDIGLGPGTQQSLEALVRRALEVLVRQARAAWQGPSAPPIRMLPAIVTWKDLPSPGTAEPPGVPLGLEEVQLAPLYIDLITAGPHFIIMGDTECGKTSLLRAWLRGLELRYAPEQVRFGIIDLRKTLLDMAESPNLFAYAYTPQMAKTCVERLKQELEARRSSDTEVSIQALRNPKSWTGPHYFLFVDDYESVISPTGNPLNPLADMLLQARDIGFHLVLARRVGGAARQSMETIFQRLREMSTPGLIMNGDPQEGTLLSTQKAGPLPPGRGYLVRRNQRTTLVQTVLAEPMPV